MQREVVVHLVRSNAEVREIASVGSSFAMVVQIALMVPTRNAPRIVALIKLLNARKVAFAFLRQAFAMETVIVRTTRMKRIAIIDENVRKVHSDVTMANVYLHTSSAMQLFLVEMAVTNLEEPVEPDIAVG